MKIESYVRGKSLEAIKRENIKMNRALTGAALAMGAGVELSDARDMHRSIMIRHL